jgi:hypothetical protein
MQLASEILAEIRAVEIGRTIELDQPVLAEVVAYSSLDDPAFEDVPADLAVVREKVPVVARDIQPPDPDRAADTHERAADVLVSPD